LTDDDSRRRLETQYAHVLAEYRFQVQLNWDRSKHYFAFNTVLLGAAVALYNQQRSSALASSGVFALLLIAALNSFHGMWAIERGHQYYRSIRRTKADLENALGMGAFAIQSTPGMLRDVDMAAAGTPQAGVGRFGQITAQGRWLLCIIGAFATLGATYAAYETCRMLLPAGP
jgi:hypothetical protein